MNYPSLLRPWRSRGRWGQGRGDEGNKKRKRGRVAMEMERCCRRRPAIDFITPVLLLLFVAYLCFCPADANPNLVAYFLAAPRRIESGYGAAFMLPLSRSSAAPEEEFPRGRRELVADARMTLHDDLLTKGLESLPLSFPMFCWSPFFHLSNGWLRVLCRD